MEYRFWQLYSDATPYTTPTLVSVEADSYKDAIIKFCREHRFKLLEVVKDEVWIEDEHGATMQYSVTKFGGNC